MRIFLLKSLIFSSLFLVPFVWAIDDEDDLLSLYDEEDLITIATGTAKQVRFAPSVATVITDDDISRLGARSLSEVLETVPGIHVSDALLFDDDLISIRGIQTSNNPQVLVLIDGVEIRHLFTAARPAGFRLPLENVQRVEIIRGPGSAVYGADAFSGVVNVITKTGADINGVTAGVRVGTFDSQDAWVTAGYANDGLDLAFSHEYTKSDGDHDRIIGVDGLGRTGQFRSEYEIYNTQIKASLNDWTLRLHNWKLSNGGNGPGGAQVLDSQGSVNSDFYQLDIGYKTELSDDWDLNVRAGYGRGETEIENTLFPAGFYPILPDGNAFPIPAAGPGPGIGSFPDGVIGNPGGTSKVTDAEFTLMTTMLDNHVVRLSAGYLKEDLDTKEEKNFGPGVITDPVNPVIPDPLTNVSDSPDVFVEDVDREVYFVSIQDEWRLGNDWELTWGVRFDEFSDVGSTVNPRLALVWAVDYNITSKFLYGRAFRAPSFTELFSQNNPTQVGNHDLDPEIIDTFEAAIDYQVNPDLNVAANIFYYEIKDLIDFVPTPSSTLEATNAIDQEGYGLEVSLSWDINEALTLESNLSLQKVEDKDTNEDIADVPQQQFYTSLEWKPANDLSLNGELVWIGERERASMDVRGDSDDYALFNLAMRRTFGDTGFELGASVKNLFDKEAEEPSEVGLLFVSTDYPIEGRSAFIDLRYTFRQ